MEYYIFCEYYLARRTDAFICEWFINGEWKEDKRRTLALEDALNDYGDYSFMDQDQITEIMATELIQKGTIVLNGDIGYGTTYYEPKKIRLRNWKRPNKNFQS
ncbi:hypothetical protein [Salinimicrobium soli]|uniref:hypothetical protein n=1 Tax=Salinimicrobium soli TaxID=1254399 RepID=UPI003AAE900B